MKTKLFTRNAFLVMIMSLVLAFSVRGTADALTFREHSTSDGDLQTLFTNEKFTITFSVNLTSSKDIYDDTSTPRRQVYEHPSTTTDFTNYLIDSSGYKLEGITVGSETKYFRKSGSDIVDSSGYLIVRTEKDDPSDTTAPIAKLKPGDRDKDSSGNNIEKKPDDPESDSLQHHYNDEAIGIIASTTGFSSLKKGNTEIERVSDKTRLTAPPGNTGYSLAEETKNRDLETDRTLSSSITLKGQVGSTPGKYMIQIVDITHLNDFPTNNRPNRQAVLTFTFYVVSRASDTTILTFSDSTRAKDYEIGNDDLDQRIDNFFGKNDNVFGVSDNVQLVYNVSGSGRLYVEETYTDSPNSKSSTTQKLSTSSQAKVYLDMNGSSNRITVNVRNQNAIEKSKSLLFILNYAQIEIISGNNQTGVPAARLINPLGIRVKDGKGRALSGLAVTFDPGDEETLQPVIGTDVYLQADNSWATEFGNIDRTFPATTAVPLILPTTVNNTGMVPTDSSGEAEVYLKLGAANTVAKVVNVSAGGDDDKFYATSAETTDIPSLEIFSGNNQKSASDGKVKDPLMVRVLASSSSPLPGTTVTFTTTKGYLSTTAAYQSDTTKRGPATQVTTTTDVNGEAAVTYDLVNHSGASDVIAVIRDINPTYERRVTFNINGTPGSTTQPTQPAQPTQPTQPTQTIFTQIPTSISGTAGGTRTLVLTAPATDRVSIGNISDSFRTAGGSASPATWIGSGRSTLTFPSTAGTYSLTVSVGTATRTVNVNVSAATPTPPSAGTPGTGTQSCIIIDYVVSQGALRSSTGRLYEVGDSIPRPSGISLGGRVVISSSITLNNVTYTCVPPTTPTQTGTLSVDVPFSGAIGSQQVATVKATGSNGSPISGVSVSLSVTNGGGVFSPASVTTGTDGTATSTLTRGTTAGTNYFVSASATGYDNVPKRISNTSATPTTGSTPTPTTTPTTPTPTTGTPNLISIDGEATRTGTVNEELDAPLVVEVLDSKGSRVRNARVTFRVRTGQGRLSQRGNGRAVAVSTNTRGLASADYTPMSARSTVEASVGGVKETVTFTITTDGSAPAATPGTSDTPSRTINPVVKVKAANRPPMLWVDGGAIYALVGADVQAFAPSVDNALNIAVGGGKVYWTEKTGESAGTINSANLDGTQVKELKSILAVPMGIAVDMAGSKLYWTNSRGRIQSANLDGSGIKNVLQNLSSPMDIALAGGNAYWTEATGAVKFVNLTGTKNVRNISTGTDAAGSLAISGNKVYWTEMTGTSAGTVNSANLDGTGVKQLASILAVPMGIAVDGSRSKLYWTNSRGRVQSANLNGSKIQNVVDGLGMPGDMVLSNSIKETPVATTKDTPKSTTTASNKYDVNGDGSVDSKDVDTLLLAVLAEVTASKYDVNGDGKVDAKDVRDVNKNLDDGVAGAPALLGSKFSALEVDRLQEQIDLLIATNDRSPAAMRTLVYLQQLIVMARPEKTQLLANYPNPFNPETWIPYELATDTDVTLTIYNAQGVVVRVLQLGQQSAGYYTDRERAAYWDGRNSQGEQVASGVYFYQLETDEMSALRKMVILK